MEKWTEALKSYPVDWLLEESNPSVRYFALTELLGNASDDPSVKHAAEQIMLEGPVTRILASQNVGGYWGNQADFYIRSKFKGTVWSFLLLAELGADGKDKRIRRSCEFILGNSRNAESGAFACRNSKQGDGERLSILPCLTGNMLFSLIRFGYLDDPRVRSGIAWITRYLRTDDGDSPPPRVWPYERYPQCWGKHSCHMGVIKMLKALSEIPAAKRSEEVNLAIERAAEYFLKHQIFKRSHDLSQVSKESWLKFGFPLMWKSDALEVFSILSRLGYRDQRMKSARDLIISTQDENGKWALENDFNGRMLVRIERRGLPSKWITLKAMTALKAMG